MNIVLIDPSLFTWPYDFQLAEALHQAGHTVRIFGRKPDATTTDEHRRFLVQHFYKGLEPSLLKQLPRGISLGLKGLSHIGSMVQLLRHLARERPDVIHFQWTPLASIDSRFIPHFRRIAPTILTAHDSKPYNDNPRSRLQRLGATEIFTRFDHVIVHTKTARERMLTYGVDADRVSIVPHGLLLQPFSANAAEDRWDRRVEILLFGQIKPYKGADVLIRAIGELPEAARQRCRVRIVGRPEMNMQPLLDLVDQLGLQDTVTFDLRFVPDSELPKLMTDADIHVFPYREIDASGVLMLGLAAGRPVVASRIGLFEELLGDLKLNRLIEPNSPAALASALAPLITDDTYRSEAAHEIIQMRSSISNWGEIATETISVYDKASANHDRQARR